MRVTGMLLAGLLLAAAGAVEGQADSAHAAEVEAGRAAAEAWLHLVDQARYQASWDSAAAPLKDAVTPAAWEQALLQARGPFEPLGERVNLTSQYADTLPGAPRGAYLLLQYRTATAEGGQIVETVVPMREADGVWRVSGYFVRPE